MFALFLAVGTETRRGSAGGLPESAPRSVSNRIKHGAFSAPRSPRRIGIGPWIVEPAPLSKGSRANESRRRLELWNSGGK